MVIQATLRVLASTFLLISLFYASCIHAKGTYCVESWEKVPSKLQFGPEPDNYISMSERGYSLVRQSSVSPVDGVVVFFEQGKIPIDSTLPVPGSFEHAAFQHNFALLHVSTGNPLDFFFADSSMSWTTKAIQDVLTANKLEKTRVYFVGLSLGGTRALKLAEFIERRKSDYWLRVAGCAGVDAPLDFYRFYHSTRNAVNANFHPTAVNEGKWVCYLLEQNLGGTPEQAPQKYARASAYCHELPNDSTAALLVMTPIRLYHEPDIDWWLTNRMYSYYDMNSIDESALIVYLRLRGNRQAELVTTWQKREGFPEKSPHTWSIVDNEDLVTWLDSIGLKK